MYKLDVVKKNKLAKEKSPYLLQHARNPVNWYPWGVEAFSLATAQDKPIFLSIGYSTCHWCHVMAEESFEDLEVAELINNTFIPIKVDREERPDIDNIYMAICQMITGYGGWPLTIIMTPEKKPFFAATYIPKENRYNRIGLLDLIPEIKKQWQNNREQLLSSAGKIIELLKKEENPDVFRKNNVSIKIDIFNEAIKELKENFDNIYGGYGISPKFPIPHQGLFLLNYYIENKDMEALEMVEKTLLNMRAGGIYDHIGSGFHRYSTDRNWILPHFEKMLYDQALLLYLFSIVYQITKKPIFLKTVEELVEYIKEKMLSKKGGFYSAEDADSEGEEGKFYLWELKELKEALQENDADKIINLYNIKAEGNFFDESIGKRTGKNILHLKKGPNLLENLKIENDLSVQRKKLYQARELRVYPQKDNKILTDWNGLMIAALAKASFVFAKKDYLEMAEKAAGFIVNNLKKSNFLLHCYCKGETKVKGLLDDYAFFIWGLIELYQVSFNIDFLDLALDLNDYLLKNFWDEEKGGFFYTSCENSELILRKKEIYDGALPSGNSIMVWNLIRLSHLSGKHILEEKAEQLVKAFYQKVKKNPGSYTQLLIGLQSMLYKYYDLIIVGNKDDETVKKLFDLLRNKYISNISIILIPPDKKSSTYKKLAQKLYNISIYKQMENKTTIYLCEDYTCKLPITDLDEVFSILE